MVSTLLLSAKFFASKSLMTFPGASDSFPVLLLLILLRFLVCPVELHRKDQNSKKLPATAHIREIRKRFEILTNKRSPSSRDLLIGTSFSPARYHPLFSTTLLVFLLHDNVIEPAGRPRKGIHLPETLAEKSTSSPSTRSPLSVLYPT